MADNTDGQRWFVLEALGWKTRDAVAFGVAVCVAFAILINGLMLQTGSHPAPMFGGPAINIAGKGDAEVLHAPSAEHAVAKPQTLARPAAEIIADIQRELTRHGFYDGLADGRYGPKTDAAVRDFEQAASLKPSAEPNEALLAVIKKSDAKPAKSAVANGRLLARPVKFDPIAELLAPKGRVLAVQRALAEFGYGQIKPTGIVDPETKSAIEKFERERKLPITGQVSDRLTRELASITGRPLE